MGAQAQPTRRHANNRTSVSPRQGPPSRRIWSTHRHANIQTSASPRQDPPSQRIWSPGRHANNRTSVSPRQGPPSRRIWSTRRHANIQTSASPRQGPPSRRMWSPGRRANNRTSVLPGTGFPARCGNVLPWFRRTIPSEGLFTLRRTQLCLRVERGRDSQCALYALPRGAPGGRTAESRPRCGLPSLGRNAISRRKQRGAGRTRLVQRSLKGVVARRGEAVWLAPHTMSRNTASAPFRPSRRAPRGVQTAESPPRCGSPPHGRNAVSTHKQRGAGRTRLVQRFPSVLSRK